MTYTIPKKKNSVVFISRFDNYYDGNLKYLFEYVKLNRNSLEAKYILSDIKSLGLEDNSLDLIEFPSLSSIAAILRSKYLITDGNGWAAQYKNFMAFRSKKIQVWHGNGIKKIGLMNPNLLKNYPKYKRLITYKYPKYDVVMMPSKTQAMNRHKAFNYSQVMINGLPRNDQFFEEKKPNFKHDDLEELITKVVIKNQKLIVYMPTWRKVRNSLDSSEVLDYDSLNDFCKQSNALFVIKQHPKDQLDLFVSNRENIYYLEKHIDIYPLLKYSDCLITDYSSIYLDYLLLDKPILFYVYDYHDYINQERELQYDFKSVTPGPMIHSFTDLINELMAVFNLDHDFSKQRSDVRDYFFHYKDDKSSKRLIDYIINDLSEEFIFLKKSDLIK